MKQIPLICSVIVTFNPMQWVDRCLQSLLESTQQTHIIIIDNASTDGCQDYIKEHFPSVEFIQSERNLGFAKSCNVGMRRALDEGADYVFLLNQDAWVEKKTLKILVTCCEKDDSIGIVSPMQMNGKNTAYDKIFESQLPQKYLSDYHQGDFGELYEIEKISAAAWLMPISTIYRVGGFDTDIFVHYGEDMNYVSRVRYLGLKCCICTSCIMCHDQELRTLEERTARYLRFNKSEHYVNCLIQMADINRSFNLYIRFRHWMLCLIKLFFSRWHEAADHQALALMVKSITNSREMYKHGGLLWLDI